MVVCPEYRIGLTLATLRDTPWYGIPYPTSHTYNPWAVAKVTGGMRAKGYGFPSATWNWTFMSEGQMWQLMSLFENESVASQEVYIRTYKSMGVDAKVADFLAIMYKPVDGSGRSPTPRTRHHFDNVTLQFAHLEEL